MTRALATAALAVILGGVLETEAGAQISPGALTDAHAALEGSRNCLQCHQSRRGVDRSRCLGCHSVLAERVRRSLGLHANPEHNDCETCHIEHQGRDFALVWWGDAGMAAFDHSATGWPLLGAHRDVACRDCHRADNISAPGARAGLGENLDRTFLGLDRSCASCHADPHQGQFAGSGCDSCHDTDRFTPASGFDHDATAFPLDGAHTALSCSACHPALIDQSGGAALSRAALRFRLFERRSAGATGADRSPRAGNVASCESCHTDPHEHRLGQQCASCHDTSSWKRVRVTGFDHDRTGYALQGRHRQVDCQACHGAAFDRPRPAAGVCTDCHADAHLGQLSDGDGNPRCETCHDPGGFVPARFTVADHRSTPYPLEGSHREVACEDCHRLTTVAEMATLLAPHRSPSDLPGAGVSVRRFRFTSTSCPACHQDPHHGTAAPAATAGTEPACTACHDLSSWHSVAFSHRATGYLLQGEHRGLDCGACHWPVSTAADAGEGLGAPALRFDGRGTACADCHRDPHADQFADAAAASAAGATRCERCHADARFRPTTFDHQLDSRFPLEGAHARVPCERCHPAVERDGATVVLYRPVPRECSACHATPPVPNGGRP